MYVCATMHKEREVDDPMTRKSQLVNAKACRDYSGPIVSTLRVSLYIVCNLLS